MHITIGYKKDAMNLKENKEGVGYSECFWMERGKWSNYNIILKIKKIKTAKYFNSFYFKIKMLDLILFSLDRKIKLEKMKQKTNSKWVLWDKNDYFGCNTSSKNFERRQISRWKRGISEGLERRKQIDTLQLPKWTCI